MLLQCEGTSEESGAIGGIKGGEFNDKKLEVMNDIGDWEEGVLLAF